MAAYRVRFVGGTMRAAADWYYRSRPTAEAVAARLGRLGAAVEPVAPCREPRRGEFRDGPWEASSVGPKRQADRLAVRRKPDPLFVPVADRPRRP